MDLNTVKREDVKVVEDDIADILAAIIGDYEARTGKTLQPAHAERLILNTIAYREALVRQQFNEACRQQHPRFATGLMLDICGDDVHTPRLSAQAARCTLRFTLSDTAGEAVLIPAGIVVQSGNIGFATVDAVQIPAGSLSAQIEAVCITAGVIGNGFALGQINNPATPLHPTIEVKASNITVPGGGIDTESDDDYRLRILIAPESFSVAGPVGAYDYFARQVSQTICDVHVGHAKDSAGEVVGGTVAVTILTKTGLPSDELLGQVQTALSAEDVRPLCDTVSARAPQVVDYTINATLTLLTDADAATTKAAARAALDVYLAARSQSLGRDIVPLDIQAALKVSGVYNVTLASPTLTEVADDAWSRCTAISITVGETVHG